MSWRPYSPATSTRTDDAARAADPATAAVTVPTPGPAPLARRGRVTFVAVALAVLSLIIVMGSPPASAGVAGIQGTVFRGGGSGGVAGVQIDLFAANGDGSRGAYRSSVVTDTNGNYSFRPADGCHVITMIAPAGTNFGGSQWYQRSTCLSGGTAPDWISATLSGSAAAPTPAQAACTPGQPIWKAVLDEQFNGTALSSAWSVYNSTGNSGFGLRRPSAVSVSGGSLNISASMVNNTLVAGGVSHNFSQKYGRYEFRVRTDKDLSASTSGIVLTWPTSGVHPRDGENNIYETLSTPGDRHEFYSFIHKPFGTVHDQDYTVHAADASQWHTMAMEWGPGKLVLYRDGQAVKTIVESSADLIPDNPHFLAIQLDAWKASVPTAVWMQVDYVKVWSYGGTTQC